jgi:hypothetical protein
MTSKFHNELGGMCCVHVAYGRPGDHSCFFLSRSHVIAALGAFSPHLAAYKATNMATQMLVAM